MDRETERAKDQEKLNGLHAAVLHAEQELEAFRMISIIPPDLIGHAVEHPIFGKGTILSLESYKLRVHFDGDERVFLYPDAFLKRFMRLSAPADMVCLVENENLKEQRREIELAVEHAREKYNIESMAFHKKWSKGAQREIIADSAH